MPNDVIKSQTREIIEAFNKKSQAGIDLIKESCQYLSLNAAEEIARFLYREKNNLDLEAVGDYLSGPEEEHKKVLEYFVQSFDFKGQPFIQALRSYLMAFKLPGEAQKIDRLVEAFAHIYWQQNQDGVIKHQDAAYILAFQTIMLNTDLHNPSIKENKKMTFRELEKQVQGLNTEFALQRPNSGEDFNKDFLKQLYDEIKATPFAFNFVKIVPGYELDSELLKDDQTFQALKSILSTAHSIIGKNLSTNKIYQLPTGLFPSNKSITDVFPKLKENITIAQVDKPKAWLNIFTGYNGTITMQDRVGAKASVQLYIPGIKSKWFLGSKPKIIVQPICEPSKQPMDESISLAAQITASFKVPVKNINATFAYLQENLSQAYATARGTERLPASSINSSHTIKRSISVDSGIGLDKIDDSKASIINPSESLLVRENVIKEASSTLVNQFFKNNKIVDEAILVERIFDDTNLSQLAKQQLLNNLLDNNHIRENKQLTKDDLAKMLMNTQFIQEQAGSILQIIRENNQDRTQNSSIMPLEGMSPQTLEGKPDQNTILTDSSIPPVLQFHELNNIEANKKSNSLQVESMVIAIKADFNNIQEYIAQELIKIMTATNEPINPNDKNFRIARDALLNADPQSNKNQGKAVISLLNSEQVANEKIEKLIKQGADPKDFDELKIEIQNIRTNLENKLSNIENIQELVVERLKQQSLSQVPFFEGDNSIKPQEKASIVAMLKPYVLIPNTICSLLNNNTKFIETVVAPFVQKRMAEFLSIEGNNEKGWCTLDKEKLSATNLAACGKALSSDFDKLLLTQSNNITINVSDLEQHIMTSTMDSKDPITNLMVLSSQVHVKGLKSLYDHLQSSSSVTLDQLKQKHQRELLSDLEQFSKLEEAKARKLPIFNQEFYHQILKPPIERSPEYNNFINKYAELANVTFIVPKNSASALLEFDRDGQTLENFRKNFFSKMQELRDSQVEQAERDYSRMAILYKGLDSKIRQISLQELKESKYIALSDEQRDFIATSWNQGTFESGWAMQYFMKKAAQEEIMPPIVDNRTPILIDVSDGVKIHNKVSMKPLNPTDITEKIPYAEMVLSVDISDMKGNKFMPGCSPKSQIAINMNFFDKNAALNLPEELIKIMKFSNESVAIENIKKDAIKGYIQMLCAQYTENAQTFNEYNFYKGWNSLSEQIGPDKAFKTVIQEVLSGQEDSIQKEKLLNEIMIKIVEPSPDNNYSFTLQQTVQMFCDVETDTISREKFASKCLDLFFRKQQVSVLDTKTHQYMY